MASDVIILKSILSYIGCVDPDSAAVYAKDVWNVDIREFTTICFPDEEKKKKLLNRFDMTMIDEDVTFEVVE